jgi:hypothetical protein
MLQQAQHRGAQIFFTDEAGGWSDFKSGTTWGRRGQTPVVSTVGARFGANLISAFSAQGQLRFMLATGRVIAAECHLLSCWRSELGRDGIGSLPAADYRSVS